MERTSVFSHLASAVATYLMALPHRLGAEKSELSAGLRTFPLVAVASCGYILVLKKVFGGDSETQARVVKG